MQRLDGLTVLANQEVITDLVLIPGVVLDEGIQRGLQPEDRLMQHDEGWSRRKRIAKRVMGGPLGVIGWVNPHPLQARRIALLLGLEPRDERPVIDRALL